MNDNRFDDDGTGGIQDAVMRDDCSNDEHGTSRIQDVSRQPHNTAGLVAQPSENASTDVDTHGSSNHDNTLDTQVPMDESPDGMVLEPSGKDSNDAAPGLPDTPPTETMTGVQLTSTNNTTAGNTAVSKGPVDGTAAGTNTGPTVGGTIIVTGGPRTHFDDPPRAPATRSSTGAPRALLSKRRSSG